MKCAWAGLSPVPLCAVWAVARQACWKPAESTTQRWLCATICHASSLPYSMANQPWQDDGWTAAAAKSHCWQTVLKLRTFPPSVFLSRVLLRVRMLYYLRQEVIGDQADKILDGADSRLAQMDICSVPLCDNLGSWKTWIMYHNLPKTLVVHLLFLHWNVMLILWAVEDVTRIGESWFVCTCVCIKHGTN